MSKESNVEKTTNPPKRYSLYLQARSMRDNDRSMPYIAKKLGMNSASSVASLLKRYDWVEACIVSETFKIEQAYGICRNCYGKGTQGNDEKTKYCDCPRGKQLEALIASEKSSLLERLKYEADRTFGNVKQLIYTELDEAERSTLTQEKNE